ncbi:MAG: 50S ribosomal protein L21 [Candidatus Wildermuthbacteria bacterium]|nr:50S ribosomal protein L21 [Candidatus Wildermuthbacteria bacterium]MBI2121411.1 50S ribosomal protein L21 [Candidatus Wildermuthbacteria bacterium]MBI2647887.1 50S ribosomal protein L21 [Candidatus Wildermuthbacteria bacterium]
MEQFAVIKTGGKQYIVTPGQKLKVEKLSAQAGEGVAFDQVLLKKDGDNLAIGNPFIANATVQGVVTRQGRAKKVITVKYKAKKRESVKRGHRQHFTEVQITSI